MTKKLSIRDIGRELGISITTVSFILNGKAKEKRISDALTQKVLDFVEKVNFRPNAMAQGLRTGKSKIICLMVEDISNNFLFSQVARLIEEEAHAKGYRIIYCSTENRTQKTRELIGIFRDRLIDGYIITPPEGVEEDIQSLLNDNIPVVLADRSLAGLDCNYVIIDNHTSAYEATKHLISQGFRNVACITIDSEQQQMADRLKGYEQAISENSLTPFVKKLDYYASYEENTAQISDFLTQNKEIDAVFFTTNYICVWGLQSLKNLNLKIPNDIGVISFDDQDLFKLYNPSISAVAQPIADISNNIITIMLNALENGQFPAVSEKVVLPSKLIIRESSQKL